MDDPRSLSFAATDGTHLHARAWGDPSRPALVLLHGAGAHAHWWDHLAPELAQSHHVVALDFRGHGASASPEEIRAGRFREDLEAMLAYLEAPHAIVVGASLGAHVAMEYAARIDGSPGPRAIVLIDPARGGSKRARRRAHLAMLLQRSSPNEAHAIARFRFLPPAPHADEATRRRVAEHSVRAEGDRFGFKFDPGWFGVPPAPRPTLSHISCPTLLVQGVDSTLLTAEGAEALAGEIPGARIAAIPDAGHNVHVERPEAFLAAIFPFFDGALAS
jgi:pimeloyl-ACP methyl ester carboxylesterase